MVILKKLYSETNLFDEVPFQLGINIIQGIYKTGRKDIGDISGIGKSTLVRLIDFVLLSDTTHTKYFNTTRYSFLKGHSVTLEIEIDNISYFIKRTFDDPKNPIFGNDLSCMKQYNEEDLKLILGNLFFGRSHFSGDFDSGWYRDLIKFFIKDDLTNSERKDPLNFIHSNSKKFELYSYNLFLLNLPNKSIEKYNFLSKKLQDLRSQRKKNLDRLKEDTGGGIEEISSEIRQINKKIEVFEKSIEGYTFSNSYENIENELINTSEEISSLLKKLAFLQKKLYEYRDSYKFEVEVDENKVINLYREIKDIFGEIVKKQLDDVLSFRKSLSENRKRFLKNKELELEESIQHIKSRISLLETHRSSLYKMLDEKKALDSIKNTYELLIEEKTKKERLSSVISNIEQLEEKIYQKNEEISKTISDISCEVHSVQNEINQISSLFFEIVQETIPNVNNKETIFDIRPQPKTNSPLNISIEVPKSDAFGRNRFRLLAYDLTVFLNIVRNERKLPHFLIHDGLLYQGISIRTVVNILNFVYSQSLMYPYFQYIITANENEILIPEDKRDVYGTYNFDLGDCIIKTYQDTPEEMIFKREY